jgi:RNA polymerase sigma factor (sigma-70 family)
MDVPSRDQDDWALAARGDGAAMARVFDRHRARVHRHAASLLRGDADAEDVVAIVFLESWRKRAGVRFVDGSLLPWLLLTATYSARNLVRASRRYQRFLERFPRDVVDDDPATRLDDGEAGAALRRLSLKDQEVITLCVVEDLTESEAAHVLNVPRGTIKSRLHRAQTRLKQQYAEPFTSSSTQQKKIPHEI